MGYADIVTACAFQFHKGTIKTSPRGFVSVVSFRFQFHKGTIKTDIHGNKNEIRNFNSIKVRLKRTSALRKQKRIAISIP